MQNEGWMMKVEWWRMKVEGCMMKDEGLKMKDEGFGGFDNRQTDRWTDICDCRVAFVTEKWSP